MAQSWGGLEKVSLKSRFVDTICNIQHGVKLLNTVLDPAYTERKVE